MIKSYDFQRKGYKYFNKISSTNTNISFIYLHENFVIWRFVYCVKKFFTLVRVHILQYDIAQIEVKSNKAVQLLGPNRYIGRLIILADLGARTLSVLDDFPLLIWYICRYKYAAKFCKSLEQRGMETYGFPHREEEGWYVQIRGRPIYRPVDNVGWYCYWMIILADMADINLSLCLPKSLEWKVTDTS